MKAIMCGANGAMGKLICDILGSEVVGKVSIDGLNGVPTSFEALGLVEADVVVDFSHHSAVESVLSYAKAVEPSAAVATFPPPKAVAALNANAQTPNAAAFLVVPPLFRLNVGAFRCVRSLFILSILPQPLNRRSTRLVVASVDFVRSSALASTDREPRRSLRIPFFLRRVKRKNAVRATFFQTGAAPFPLFPHSPQISPLSASF